MGGAVPPFSRLINYAGRRRTRLAARRTNGRKQRGDAAFPARTNGGLGAVLDRDYIGSLWRPCARVRHQGRFAPAPRIALDKDPSWRSWLSWILSRFDGFIEAPRRNRHNLRDVPLQVRPMTLPRARREGQRAAKVSGTALQLLRTHREGLEPGAALTGRVT